MGYAEDTDYATRNLIHLISHEELELRRLIDALRTEEAKYKAYQWDFETSEFHEDFSDAYVQGAFIRMATAHRDAEKLRAQMSTLQASIGTRQAAIQAMCGALLQIAKQGISLVHGNLLAAPTGRLLSGIALKDIVWQARNQALHYEDGQFRQPVIDLFQRLEATFGQTFSLTAHPQQSRAKQIVVLLGWTTYDEFHSDLKRLGL
ncbi:hypothetical protein [Sinorhizobium meliloti]|uniref:hypothetical protein n=1 Tax=Rhizobium meliloti TaxID=382 RepID=UPI001296EC65|nr:hypothetical protein [Sinorhizobium meliloti]MQX70034.1 hypothetical protein [Sinorhizobium meliloti]